MVLRNAFALYWRGTAKLVPGLTQLRYITLHIDETVRYAPLTHPTNTHYSSVLIVLSEKGLLSPEKFAMIV